MESSVDMATVTVRAKYIIGPFIAGGHHGKVFQTIDVRDQKKYAIKRVEKKLLEKDEIGGFNVEREMLQLLHGLPFISQLHETFQTTNNICFVSSLNVMDLYTYINQEKYTLTDDQMVYYARELIAGIGYIHSKNIVHRDLKLENVMFGSDGHIVIIDFDMAFRVEEGTREVKNIGTLEYLSPEMANGDVYTYSIDYWALGVILYEFVYKRPPFKCSRKSSRSMKQKLKHEIIRLPKTSPLDVLILGLLEKKVSNRLGYRNARLFDINLLKCKFQGVDWSTLQQLPPPADVLRRITTFASIPSFEDELVVPDVGTNFPQFSHRS
jgi:serine/threonine protein kinase